MKRRTFLTASLVGTASLALGVNLVLPEQVPVMSQDKHRVIFSVLIPVFMDGALPEMDSQKQLAIDRTIAAIHDTMSVLPQAQYQELLQLIELLESQLGLLILTGSMTPLLMRSPAHLVEMLDGWRDSALSLFQQAYLGLRELVMASYYACPEHWTELNYAKPILFKEVN